MKNEVFDEGRSKARSKNRWVFCTLLAWTEKVGYGTSEELTMKTEPEGSTRQTWTIHLSLSLHHYFHIKKNENGQNNNQPRIHHGAHQNCALTWTAPKHKGPNSCFCDRWSYWWAPLFVTPEQVINKRCNWQDTVCALVPKIKTQKRIKSWGIIWIELFTRACSEPERTRCAGADGAKQTE